MPEGSKWHSPDTGGLSFCFLPGPIETSCLLLHTLLSLFPFCYFPFPPALPVLTTGRVTFLSHHDAKFSPTYHPLHIQAGISGSSPRMSSLSGTWEFIQVAVTVPTQSRDELDSCSFLAFDLLLVWRCF